jgi:septal ring factor EnvC (AmiA/AmiB activator)
VSVSGVFKWTAAALLAAVPAAVLAYLGGPIAAAGLAGWAAVVIVALAARHDSHLSGLHTTVNRTARGVSRVREQNNRLRASVKELKAENAALQRQVTKARSALDDKIALSVQRMNETFKAEVGGLAAAIRDSEVETGLAALNRYTALAAHPAVLLGDADTAPSDTAE